MFPRAIDVQGCTIRKVIELIWRGRLAAVGFVVHDAGAVRQHDAHEQLRHRWSRDARIVADAYRHLDATNKQLRLLVGNSITPVAVNSHINGAGDRSASGPLVFGPAPMAGRFEGPIANPVMVPGVVDHIQLARLNAFELPFTD